MIDAKSIVNRELDAIINNASIYASNDSCIACHMIFKISEELDMNESDAADLLSNILNEDKVLNEKFIDVIESIHMKARSRALSFYNKSRDAKDRYLELYVKNAITELKEDGSRYGKDIILRKLVLSYLSGYLAQTLGLDFHSSTEELYYLLRKKEDLEDFISEFLAYFSNG